MKALRALGILSFMGAVLLACVPAGIITANNVHAAAPPNTARFKGTVVEVYLYALAVRADDGHFLSVHLRDSTRYRVDGALVAARPTFHEGQRVRVLGTWLDDETVRARVVSINDRWQDLPHIQATVLQVFPNMLQVKRLDGVLETVRLNEDTIYVVDGLRVATRPVFREGQSVRAVGTRIDDETMNGKVVSIDDRRADRVRFAATVTEVAGDLLIVRRDDGAYVFVKLSEDAYYFINGKLVPRRPLFREGEAIRVVAVRIDDATFRALKVFTRVIPEP
ncbi:MAG: hypothetical protein ACR2JC_02520 [Chloroflexota bacterium]|nr:MAG: hypothetical protein DLM70_03535 [Chloroflexota bacterium]